MSASRPAIEAAGLGRDYGATRALDSLELAFQEPWIDGLPTVEETG